MQWLLRLLLLDSLAAFVHSQRYFMVVLPECKSMSFDKPGSCNNGAKARRCECGSSD
jgi:hypothetical protein